MPKKVEKSLVGRARVSKKSILNHIILYLATKLIFYYLWQVINKQEVIHG